MSDKRICKYCGMELSEDVPHGLRECHLHAVARIAALKGVIEILEDQQREAKNILIDKNLHIDSLYEEGYKLQQRIAELEAAQRWIPVSERLPEAYEKVIALAKDCMNVDWVLPKELREVGKGAFARLYNVTHWMPLPEPPIVYGKESEG